MPGLKTKARTGNVPASQHSGLPLSAGKANSKSLKGECPLIVLKRVGLTLFFCLLFSSAFAANSKPQVGTITPSSGTSAPNQQVSFTTTYSDANGWQNIQYVYLLINTSVNGANCFYGYYNQNTNKLYLRDNKNKKWLGGYAPGSSYIIQNSYAKLDCSKTTVSGSGNTLSVNWNITFKSTFIGTKNMYLYVKDDAGAYQGWTKKGTWIINSPPKIISVLPLDHSTFIVGDNINISINASDPEKDSLRYRYLIDNTIIKDWTTYSSFSFMTNIQNQGRHTLKVEVKDAKGGLDSKTIIIYIFRKFPKPAG